MSQNAPFASSYIRIDEKERFIYERKRLPALTIRVFGRSWRGKKKLLLILILYYKRFL